MVIVIGVVRMGWGEVGGFCVYFEGRINREKNKLFVIIVVVDLDENY